MEEKKLHCKISIGIVHNMVNAFVVVAFIMCTNLTPSFSIQNI